MKNGARGVESKEAKTDPTVVSIARRSVARVGEKRAPARTFCVKRNSQQSLITKCICPSRGLTQRTLPGIDQACIQIVMTEMTATTWAR